MSLRLRLAVVPTDEGPDADCADSSRARRLASLHTITIRVLCVGLNFALAMPGADTNRGLTGNVGGAFTVMRNVNDNNRRIGMIQR